MDDPAPASLNLVITAEQIRTAPREVRQWLHRLLGAPEPASLVFERNGFRYTDETLALLDEEEVLALLRRLDDDTVATQVLFQFGTNCFDPATGAQHAHPVDTAEIARHTSIETAQAVPECLHRIDDALRGHRGEPRATLFRQHHPHGSYSVHETTQLAIYRVWQRLMRPRGPDVRAALDAVAPVLAASAREDAAA